jgi:SWI/SNF-related matrix-associated actin-dependent regulator 1 of chromatin subfamily A
MKKVSFDRVNNIIVFQHPYDNTFIDFVKQKKCWWEPELKVWSLPNQRNVLQKVSQIISRFNMEVDQSIADSVLCDLVLPEDQLNVSPKTVSDEVRSLMLEELKEIGCLRIPRDYQLAAVFQGFQWDNILLGDDMGLGKTCESIMLVELLDLFPCLIISPASVKYGWKREWKRWFGNKRNVDVVDDDYKFPFTGDVLVSNYDRVIDRKVKGSDIKKGNSHFFKEVPWKCLILDESHYIKTPKSERSKSIKEIAHGVDKKIFLTGTPTLNCPSELINQLETLDVFERVFGHWLRFVRRYCDAKKTSFGWDISGAINIEELNMVMRKTFYIRREKREVLHELPDIQQSIVEIEISNRKEYNKAEFDLLEYLKQNKSLVASQKAANAEQLVLLKTLRMLSGKGKVESCNEFIQNFIESTDRKLLIFGVHRETLDGIVNRFGCMRIDGQTDSSKRLPMVERFMKNSDRVMCGNIKSLGLGTDGLQECCSDIFILELPDTPGDIDQTISRLERFGQKNAINVYIGLALKTIDIKLWDSLQRKKRVIDGVNKGTTIETTFNIMNDILFSYLKNI